MESKPQYLHMYFSLKNAMLFLESFKLKLSSPASFNDPFEFLPKLNNTDEYRLNASQNIKTITTNMIADPTILIGKMFYDLYMYGKDKIDKRMSLRLEQITQRYRVACFSEEENNILLWSHYGDKHQGVVITFKNAFEYFENNIEKVEYSKERVKVPLSDKLFSSDEQIIIKNWERKLLITKSDCWSYEKEWRLIKTVDRCMNDNGYSFYQLDKKCVSSVTLGCCMSGENRKMISDYLRNNDKNISVKYSIPSDDGFYLTTGT